MRRWKWVAAASCALCAACAVMEPPPGGPEDKTPPRVLSVFPRDDSAGVSRAVRPSIVFSEKIDEASFKNRVAVFPPVTFDRLSAKGERLEIVFAAPLPETTLSVVLIGGYRDQHLVPNPAGTAFCFSTADSIDRGSLSGFVLFKDKPDSAGAVELFRVRPDSTTEIKGPLRARVAFAARDGSWAIRGLPTNEAAFLVRGFIDRDGDGHFSEGKEFGLLLPDTIVLGPLAASRAEIRINVIDPNEPGSVEGTIVDETGLPLSPTVRLDPVARGERALVARADSAGRFVVGRVPPGSYVLSAFVDMKQDTLCGSYPDPADSTRTLAEPCVTLPDTLSLKPAEKRVMEPFILPARKEGAP